MNEKRRPTVVMIDDEPDSIRARAAELRGRANVIIRAPGEVTLSDLRDATVFLVDYRIPNWAERDSLDTIALQPTNGLALVAVLRAYASERVSTMPRAFTIHSGVLSDLVGGLSARMREHVVARAKDLEWVFAKSKSGATHGPGLGEQVASLAEAVHSIRTPAWPKDRKKADARLKRLLALPADASWADRARADVESCHPPAHDFAVATNGLAPVRWLLHHILPFPCFLWDYHYLAARFRVTPPSLLKALTEEAKARRALRTLQYRGALEDFLGPRWWRVGIEQTVWDWTDGKPFDREVLTKALRRRISAHLDFVEIAQPVVCVDSDFRPTDSLIDLSSAVEIQPDEWPSYAEQAWISLSDARDDEDLRTLVVTRDRERLTSELADSATHSRVNP